MLLICVIEHYSKVIKLQIGNPLVPVSIQEMPTDTNYIPNSSN